MYTTTIVLVQWGLLDVSSSSGWPTTNPLHPLRTMCRRQQMKLCLRRLLPPRRLLLLPRDIQALKTDPLLDNPDNLSSSSSSPSFRAFCGGNRSGHDWQSSSSSSEEWNQETFSLAANSDKLLHKQNDSHGSSVGLRRLCRDGKCHNERRSIVGSHLRRFRQCHIERALGFIPRSSNN